MASSGNLICYSNFSNTYSGELLLNKTGTGVTKVYSAYVSSPSWYAQVTFNKEYMSGADIAVSAAYWNGSTWVDAWSDTQRVSNQETAGEKTYKYYHNSTLGSTSGDVASAVLWELYFDHMELYDKRMWVYTGGIRCMPEDTYNNLYRGRPIYSCGRLGSSSIYGSSEGRARDTALSIFSQSADSGTLITASNETKLVAYKYN